MKIYVTSKNNGPSNVHESKKLLYIGASLHEALETVGDFVRHREPKDKWPTRYPYLYSAIPEGMKRRTIEFFQVDGWWYSIVQIDIEPNP